MQNSTRISTEGVLAVLFVAGLCAAPWPLGSNRDWAWPVLTVIFSLICLTLVIRHALPASNHARLALAAYLSLGFWILFQLTGLPFVIDPITINTWDTSRDLLKTFTLGSVFLISVMLFQQETILKRALRAVLVVAMLQALLGAFQQLVFETPRSHGSFPNPNHFAGYLETSLGIGIGLLLASTTGSPGERFSMMALLTGPVARLRLMIVILVVALVMSRSRMGNLAFLFSLAICSAVWFQQTRRINRTMLVLLVSIVLIDVLIISQYFGLQRLQERLQQAPTEQGSARADLPEYHFRIIADRPFMGSGAGTYESVFPQYRDIMIGKRATHAENDYLELLIELGIIGCLPLLVILLVGLHAQIKLMRQPGFESGIAFGCLVGTVALIIHGFADVNLQIPSNAIMFVLLLSIPIALIERGARNQPLQ